MTEIIVKGLFVTLLILLVVIAGSLIVSSFPLWSTSVIGWASAISVVIFLILVGYFILGIISGVI
jgi:hypothetical protein